ncbi:hypothetical protein LT330_001623 [Penicillium expansum]|nr:hypothetical protein LT330_001623 [Penicillium expansum]
MPPKRIAGRPSLTDRPLQPDEDEYELDGLCRPDAHSAISFAGHLAHMNEQAQWILQNVYPNDKLPYYDTVEYDEQGCLVVPPVDVRLSDALVFLVSVNNLYPGKARSGRWPSDFNSDGDIVPERWPMGDAVVIWAHGLPFLPVFGGYYILTGARLRHYTWILDKKRRRRDMPITGIHFGEVVAPPTQIGDNPLQMQYDDGEWRRFHSRLTMRCSPTDLIMTYTRDIMILTPLPYIIGFHPHSGELPRWTMDQPDDISDEHWRKLIAKPYTHASDVAIMGLGPGAHVDTSLLRRPHINKYTNDDHDDNEPAVEDTTTDTPTSPSKRRRTLQPSPKKLKLHPSPAQPKSSMQSPTKQSSSTQPKQPSNQSQAAISDATDRTDWSSPTADIRRLIGGFSTDIIRLCDSVDELSKRLHVIKQIQKSLDTPLARAFADAVETELRDNGNDIASYTLGNIVREIHQEAATLMTGQRDQPIIIAPDDKQTTAADEARTTTPAPTTEPAAGGCEQSLTPVQSDPTQPVTPVQPEPAQPVTPVQQAYQDQTQDQPAPAATASVPQPPAQRHMTRAATASANQPNTPADDDSLSKPASRFTLYFKR